jgi:transposase
VAASIDLHIVWLDEQIEAATTAIRAIVADDPVLKKNFTLLLSIPGFGEITAALLIAELPRIESFTPKALSAFVGLSPREHSSGERSRDTGISRIGLTRLRTALFLCALSARRYNPRLREFVARLDDAKKAKKVILVAVARKLLIYAQAVIRTQKPFDLTAELLRA